MNTTDGELLQPADFYKLTVTVLSIGIYLVVVY